MTDQADTTLRPEVDEPTDNSSEGRQPSDWVVAAIKSAANRRSKQPEHPLGENALTTVPPGFEIAGAPSLQLMWLAALRFELQAKHHEMIENRDSLADFEEDHRQIHYNMDYVDEALDRRASIEFGLDGKSVAVAFQADWTMIYRQLPDELVEMIQEIPFGLRSGVNIDGLLRDMDKAEEPDETGGDDIMAAFKAMGEGPTRMRVVIGSPEIAEMMKKMTADDLDIEVAYGGSMSGERLASILGNDEAEADPADLLRGMGIPDDVLTTGSTIKNMLERLRNRQESDDGPSFEDFMRGMGDGDAFDFGKKIGIIDADGNPDLSKLSGFLERGHSRTKEPLLGGMFGGSLDDILREMADGELDPSAKLAEILGGRGDSELSEGRRNLFGLLNAGAMPFVPEDGAEGSPTNIGDTFGNNGSVHAGEGDQVNVERIEVGFTINLHFPNPPKKRKKKKKKS